MIICIVLLSTQKTFKRETEVENWVQRYDTEMGEKQVCPLDLYIHALHEKVGLMYTKLKDTDFEI